MRLEATFVLACVSAFCQQPAGALPAGTYRVGDGVSAPAVIAKTDPEYSEEARKARLTGSVMLSLIVGVDGTVRDVHVDKSLGLGLDEEAVSAVGKWRFQPGLKGGMPVSVAVTVEVNLRLMGQWGLSRVVFFTPDRAARPTIDEAPYPDAYSPAGETGSVRISFDVNRAGNPENFHIEKSSNPSLESEVTAILKGWKFHPAMQDDNPIPVRCMFEFVKRS